MHTRPFMVRCINSAQSELLIGEYYLATSRLEGPLLAPYFSIEPLPDEILFNESNFVWDQGVSRLTEAASKSIQEQEAFGSFISYRFDFIISKAMFAQAVQMRKARAEFTRGGIPGASAKS